MSRTKNLIKALTKQEIEAKEFGFTWDNIDQILDQIVSECEEVKQAWLKNDQNNLKEEIGDTLNAALSLGWFCDIDPLEALENSYLKIEKRLKTMKSLMKEDGLADLKSESFEKKIFYWEKAKKIVT